MFDPASDQWDRAESVGRHKQVAHFDDVAHAVVETASTAKNGGPRPFPLQVDGDYIGERGRVVLRAAPGALTIVA